MMRRILSYLALALGLAGTIACLGAMAAIWSVSYRARQTTESAFERIDQALVVLHDRTERTADRVRDSAMTTRSVAEGLKQWTRQQAVQEIAQRLQVAENTDRLRLALQQADSWLEVSESSAGLVQEAISIGNSLGAQIDTQPVDGLLDEIAALRNDLEKARQVVENLHERATANGEIPRDRIEQAIQLTLRVAATLASIDGRLDRVADQLSRVQENSRRLESRLLTWIRIATVAVVVLVAWIAAGQVALCYLAWRAPRRETG